MLSLVRHPWGLIGLSTLVMFEISLIKKNNKGKEGKGRRKGQRRKEEKKDGKLLFCLLRYEAIEDQRRTVSFVM